MSILVISSYVGKSPEDLTLSFIFDEIYRLAKNGIDVHVVRSKVEKDSISYSIHFHGIENKIDPQALSMMLRNMVRYPPISLFRGNISLYRENLYATNIIRVAKKNHVDLIHAHFAYPEGFVGVLAKRIIKKPLIVTCHGYDINTVPEVGYGIRLRKEYDALVRTTLKNADAIICVSTNMRKEVLKLGVSPNKTFVVPNAVDLELFRPPHNKQDLKDVEEMRRLFNVNEDDFLILNARHLNLVYGIDYLIYAAKVVVQHVKNVKFIVAGEGVLKEKLCALIQKMGLQNHVKLVGKIPRMLMPKLMRATSLYVNTSLADGTPPSLIEACASGVPIVSFNVGGISDIIDDGVNGYLVEPRDYKTMAFKIIYLLNNPGILHEFGFNARRKAEITFDINARIAKIIDIYNETRL